MWSSYSRFPFGEEASSALASLRHHVMHASARDATWSPAFLGPHIARSHAGELLVRKAGSLAFRIAKEEGIHPFP